MSVIVVSSNISHVHVHVAINLLYDIFGLNMELSKFLIDAKTNQVL